MESGEIPDTAITASLTYHTSYKPSHARLVRGGSSCSWAPTDAGSIGSWLQVDLGQLTTVTGIETQGTCYSSTEWAKTYSVSYSNEPNSWTPYEESGNVKVNQHINLVYWTLTQQGFRNQYQTRFHLKFLL